MPKFHLPVLLLVLCGFLSGCATGRFTVADSNTDYPAKPDQALVVIMRPSTFGAAISSSVFDATGDQNKLIAVLGPKEKVAYYCPPGDRLFMVISENADFMEARLDAGKIYYAIVTPRTGMWKARFSLHPFKVNHAEKEFRLDSANLRQWLAACHFVKPDAKSLDYGQTHASDIQARRADYSDKWARMLEQDKQWRRLLPEDGVTSPVR
ncbi:hypothetical protein K0B96_03070 [Horticoccus luteus]|uniref:DUF2846 domain-containing protein n=1 Tax=Horticoccus luteus TaxID=2862869 RepID=A0A8F9XHR3_9BACT|nr:hypothetical protein [Horticoccus luteus]QYM79615.1 hypothetical protein K0B96_03070 [Horticoccus luteus]